MTRHCRQARSATPGTSSSRSPVSVSSAQSRSRTHVAAQRGASATGRTARRSSSSGIAAVHLVAGRGSWAALEDRERRTPAEQRLDGVDQRRQVAVDELALQRDRGGGDDHGLVGGVQERRHQVGQRLAGAGAGLDEQVLPSDHGGLRRPRPSAPGPAARCRRPRPPPPRAARARPAAGPRRAGRRRRSPTEVSRARRSGVRPCGRHAPTPQRQPAAAGLAAYGASSAASAGPTRARTRVPSATWSSLEQLARRRCTRDTRSPRSYGTQHVDLDRRPRQLAARSAARSSSMPSPGAGRDHHACAARGARSRSTTSGSATSALLMTTSSGTSCGVDLGEHLAHGGELRLGVGVGAVDDVQDQVGVGDLLQRRAERLDQLVRQVPDEADGVGERVVAAVGGLRPGARSGRGWRTARSRRARRRR